MKKLSLTFSIDSLSYGILFAFEKPKFDLFLIYFTFLSLEIMDSVFHPTIKSAASVTTLEVFSEPQGSIAKIGLLKENSFFAILTLRLIHLYQTN